MEFEYILYVADLDIFDEDSRSQLLKVRGSIPRFNTPYPLSVGAKLYKDGIYLGVVEELTIKVEESSKSSAVAHTSGSLYIEKKDKGYIAEKYKSLMKDALVKETSTKRI